MRAGPGAGNFNFDFNFDLKYSWAYRSPVYAKAAVDPSYRDRAGIEPDPGRDPGAGCTAKEFLAISLGSLRFPLAFGPDPRGEALYVTQ